MAFVPPPPTFARDRAKSEAFARRNLGNLILEESDQASVTTGTSNPFANKYAVPSELPAWFETGFDDLDQQRSRGTDSRSGNWDAAGEGDRNEEGIERQNSREHFDTAGQEDDLLKRYGCEGIDTFSREEKNYMTSRKGSGSKVVISKVVKGSSQAVINARREITILNFVRDPSLPTVMEWLELKDSIWIVKSYRPCQTLTNIINHYGPFSVATTKTALNQLFSGIASLFMAGFAHLRICPETVCLDENQQLLITDVYHACSYGKEKVGDFYAPTQEKQHGFSDLYVAPEVFANNTYNARKATIWSCGVLIYFMTTGQTEKLSNLDHPVFEKGSSDNNNININNEGSNLSSNQPQSESQNQEYTNNEYEHDPNQENNHRTRRRLSTAVTNAKSKIILYPDRFAAPNYCRAIIPRMLVHDPRKRAELIEVATRVPKDYLSYGAPPSQSRSQSLSYSSQNQNQIHTKQTRPLMELAWLDYKTHVGPYAGLDIGADPRNESSNERTGFASSIFGDGGFVESSAGSIMSVASGFSAFSNPFASLLGRNSKSNTKSGGGGGDGGKTSKERRRQSAPVTSRFERYA